MLPPSTRSAGIRARYRWGHGGMPLLRRGARRGRVLGTIRLAPSHSLCFSTREPALQLRHRGQGYFVATEALDAFVAGSG